MESKVDGHGFQATENERSSTMNLDLNLKQNNINFSTVHFRYANETHKLDHSLSTLSAVDFEPDFENDKITTD